MEAASPAAVPPAAVSPRLAATPSTPAAFSQALAAATGAALQPEPSDGTSATAATPSIAAPDAAALPTTITIAPPTVPAPAATVAPTATATAAASAAATPTPLLEQVTGPIVNLRQSPAGEHVMTLRVSPENLGPVTVRAHISASGMQVEMFASTERARDALTSLLPDLRRDLAASGASSSQQSSTSLNLGSGDSPAGQQRDRSDADGMPRFPGTTLRSATMAAPEAPARATSSRPGGSLLDVMA